MSEIVRYRMKQLREKKGYTQIDIAEMIGVKRSAYSLWEIGKRKPDIDDLIKIADIYDVTLDWLAGREKPQRFSQ